MLERATTTLITHTRRPAWQVALLALLPGATLIVSIVFGAVPLASVSWAMIVPDMLAPVLFFWCVHRARTVPILLVFLLGMAADIMHDSPLGVHTLAYMALALGAKAVGPQLNGLGLSFSWGVFSIFMMGFVLIKLLTSMIGTPGVLGYPALTAVLQSVQLALTTIVAYPLFHLILALMNGISKGPSDLAHSSY